MLPKVLSAVGLLLIAAALLGFALPLSTAPAGAVTDVSVLSGGESSDNPNSANTNMPDNGNVRPTPTSTATPDGSSYNRNYNSQEDYRKDEANYRAEAKNAGSTIGSGLEDGWIHLKVRAALAAVDDLRDSTVNVDVDNNVVTLRGSVASPAQKAMAEGIVRRVEGVKSVVNKLEVKSDGRSGAKSIGARRPVENVSVAAAFQPPGVLGDAVVPARPRSAAPPNLFIEIQAGDPEKSKVEVERPGRLGISDTGTIRVALVNEPVVSATPITDIPGNLVQEFSLPLGCIPAGTSLRSAYGPQFAARATAKLTTADADFEVTPSADEEQPLDSPRTTWTWLIRPKRSGSRNVTLATTVRWKHRQRNQEKPSCRVLYRSFPIYVEDRWYNEENLKTAQTIIGIVGLALQLPVFIWNRKKGKDDQEEKKE